jgi:hypothetical protein
MVCLSMVHYRVFELAYHIFISWQFSKGRSVFSVSIYNTLALNTRILLFFTKNVLYKAIYGENIL